MFECNTNRMTFEYAPNMMIVKVHPRYSIIFKFLLLHNSIMSQPVINIPCQVDKWQKQVTVH